MAVGPLQPRSMASTTRARMAGRGWTRPWRLRGSGTSARASIRERAAMTGLRCGRVRLPSLLNPSPSANLNLRTALGGPAGAGRARRTGRDKSVFADSGHSQYHTRILASPIDRGKEDSARRPGPIPGRTFMALLRTPLYDWHAAHGGRLVDFAGWEMPTHYTTITEEHTAVRTAAG